MLRLALGCWVQSKGNETCGFGLGGAVGQLLSSKKGNLKKRAEEERTSSRREMKREGINQLG